MKKRLQTLRRLTVAGIALLIFSFGLLLSQVQAQTVLISPTGDGGFENGATFGANGWTLSNSANNPWVLDTADGYSSAPMNNRRAFVRDTGSTVAYYDNTKTALNYFYRDITVPSGQSKITLSFNWMLTGENNWDLWQVFVSDTNIVPVGTTTHPGSGATNVPAGITGATYIGNGSPTTGIQTSTFLIPGSYAGTTFRLIFAFKVDGSGGSQPPAIIDNISLISEIPTITAAGGIFTINNLLPTAGSNFNNFNDAILNANAITGNLTNTLTFNVTAGQTFNENPAELTKSGTMNAKIIFRKSGSGANPIVNATGTATANEAAISIAGSDYIVFDGIDVSSSNALLEFGYRVRNSNATTGSDFIVISNAKITLSNALTTAIGVVSTSSTAAGGFTAASADGRNTFNEFHNLVIENCGLGGIYLISGSTTFMGESNKVYNVTVGSAYVGTPNGSIGGLTTASSYGIFASNQVGFQAYNCTIRNIVSSGIKRGIYVAGARGETNIYNNKIYGIHNNLTTSLNSSRGIDVTQSTTTGFNNVTNVYNNEVSDLTAAYTGTASATRAILGMFIGTGSATSEINIYNNTVVIDGSGSLNASNVCIEWGGSAATYNVRNNHFINNTGAQTGVAKHYILRTTSATLMGTASSIINNNNYFLANTTNGFMGLLNATDAATIAAIDLGITSPASNDANTVSINPLFVNAAARDFRPQVKALDNSGVPLAVVTTDINGNPRSSTPDIGAHEISIGAPVVITNNASNISQTAATLNGSISSSFPAVTASGILYGTSNNLTLGGVGVTDLPTAPLVTLGAFNASASGLSSGASYFFRAYAVNGTDTGYGAVRNFAASIPLPFIENFDSAFVGMPAAPPGWTQTRLDMWGDGVPTAVTIAGPKDWEQITNVGTAAWNKTNFATAPNAAVSGSNALWLEEYYFGTGTNMMHRRLETPTLDLSTSTSPFIRFHMFYANSSSYLYPLMVMASKDNGVTWNPIMHVQPGFNAPATSSTGSGIVNASNPWQVISVKIPAEYRISGARFALQKNAAYSFNGNVFIDSLTIDEFVPTTITSAQNGNWSDTATWVGGIVPTADNHVVIASGHEVALNQNIARTQTLTVSGFLRFFSTSTITLLQTFDSMTVLTGGTYTTNNTTTVSHATSRWTYIGGSLNNAGTLNLGTSTTSTVVFTGGTLSSLTNTGTITNGYISQMYMQNSGGFVFNSPVTIRNNFFHIEGSVNPNGNLNLGLNGNAITVYRSGPRANFTQRPNFPFLGTSTLRTMYYGGTINGNMQQAVLSQESFTPGFENDTIPGAHFVRGSLVVNTQHRIVLTSPLQIGRTDTAVGGATTFTRGIVRTSLSNPLIIGWGGTGALGAIPTNLAPNFTQGSYVVGPIRFVRPTTNSTAINAPLGVGEQFMQGGLTSNVRNTLTVTPGATWSGQDITVWLDNSGNPSSNVGTGLTSTMGKNIYRIQRNNLVDLPASATIGIRAQNFTHANSDNFFGSQGDIYVAQAASATGPWERRSLTLGGTAAVAINTEYLRTTSAATPGPIAPLATNGEFFTIASGAAPMTFVSADVVRNTDGVSAGALNMPIIRVRVSVSGIVPISARNFNFARTGTTNPAAIANAKVYYTGTNPNFSTSNQIGSTINAPVPATFSVNQNITLVDGDNYFWVAYDIASGAALGDLLAAECVNVTVADTIRTLISPAAGGRTVTLPMTLVASNAAQPLLGKVEQNSINNLILRLDVEMSATGAPIAANSFSFNTNGSVLPNTNITNAKLYYTGTNGTFLTNNLFGTQLNPNGSFTINGNVNLANGMNYFWLSYDIPTTAVVGDSVDAEYTGLVLNGAAQTAPVLTAPVGSRQIRAPYCISAATSAGDEEIFNVNISTLNNASNCTTLAPGPGSIAQRYSNYTTLPATNLVAGITYPLNVTINTCGGFYGEKLNAYIDWNQDGDFNDTLETVMDIPASTGTANAVRTANITVPCFAATGETRLRIVYVEATAAPACGTYTWGETEDYTVNIVNAPPTYLASNAIQQVAQVGAGSTDVPILRVPVKVISTLCAPGTLEQLNFNTAGTTSAGDILAAKLYRTGNNAPFSTTNLVGTVSTPSGAFSFPLTDTTFNDTNNYWLAYDVSSSAANSNLLDARFDSVLVFGTWRTPINANPTGAVTVTVPMTYLGSDANHVTLAKVERGTVNNQFLRIVVHTSSTGAPINATQFSLNTNGSANPLTNMDSAIIWYTGSNPNFATTNFFGGVGAQSGAFNINGLQSLVNDTNYFWLTYNLPATAAIGDSLDAEISGITIAGAPQTPTTTAPAGAREIRAPYCLSGATTAFDSDIGRVIFTSGSSQIMNVGTGCGTNQTWATGTYTNNTGITGINLVAGGTINFDICYASSGAAYNSGMAIYIDFNQNGLWDAGEMVYTAPTQLSTNWIGSFTIPCTALNGPTRMRIVSIEFTNLTLANSCGTFSYGETEDYTVNIIREPASYVASTTIQQVSTTSAGAVNIPVLRVPLIARATPCLPGIISQLNFNTAGSTTAGDILNAKLYKTGNSATFSTANLVGTVAAPNGDFSFLISDTAVNDTNNYWLAYDISTSATNANVVDARFDSAEIFGTWRTPAVSAPAGNVLISVPMTYIGSNMIHPTLSKVERGSTLNQMARIMVVTSSSGAPIPVTEFSLNTNGSASPLTNIDSIIVWYTGANPNLVSPVFFGSSGSNTAPFNITGSRNLLNDTNYFWVTYNIPATANVGDSVDVEVTSITVGGTPQTPSTTAPSGARLIRSPYCVSAATVPLADGEIWNVTLGTLNNTTSCTTTGGTGSIQGGYSNFTETIAAPSLAAGSITPFSVNTSTCGGDYNGVLGIWIDFNDDGDFTDAGEEVHMTPAFLYGTAVFRTGDITVPLNVAPGLKRMRVAMIETTVSPISPCVTYGYGETEDYTVNILPAPTPTTYVWNQTAPATFTTAANWTPTRSLRNLNDRLAFNANATINNVTSQEVASIDVSNNAVVNLNAAAGENLAAWDSLNLISGRLVGNANLTFTVGNSNNIGTITGAGGVQGTLARWVDTLTATVNFPLVQGGASRRATLSTSVAPVSRGTVIVRFVPGIPGSAGVPFLDGFLPVNKVSENGVWRIEAGNGFNPGANGSYNLALQADSFAGVNAISSLTIIRRANATANWDTAGVYDFATGTNASFVANRLDLRVFGEFTLGSDSAVNPLPVKLITFNANPLNNDVLLTWKTAMELNNKGFMVERSLDGRKFEAVNFVKGNGTTSQISNYLLLDEKAFTMANTLYYRLRQIDFDETESFSNIVKVERSELSLSNVTAVPNPFIGSTKIEFVSANTSPYVISIVDVQGKEIATRTVNVKEGMNSITLPELESVNAGIYFINVNGVESRTLKVVKTAN
jgi:hypothetical protein